MPSWQSRAFVFALKHRHLLRFRKRTDTIAWNTSIPKLREETNRKNGLMGKLPPGIEVSPVRIGDLYAEWIRPLAASQDHAILYFHGGGYVVGSCAAHQPIVAKFVKGTGIPALLFEYRLAPENPFPAALEDALAAYRFLLDKGIEPCKIAFIGDSAGGGLCLATLLALKDQGRPLPAAVSALSPWTDLTCTGESLKTNANVDTLTWAHSWTVFSNYYAGERDLSHPWISPLWGDLANLPPLMIHVGGDELLRDDSTRFATKAEDAGVDVILRIGEGLFHCYPACAPLFPEATQALQEICLFIQRHLKISSDFPLSKTQNFRSC